jgi:hypothetical protein
VLKKKIWANFQRIIKLFTPKIVTKLSKIWVWDPGSGKNLFRIQDPGVKKAPDPGSGSATLFATYQGQLDTVATGSVVDQHFRSILISDLMTKICRIILVEKIPHEGRLCYRRSLQPSKQVIQHKVLLLLFECIVFALLDQDLADPNQCGSMRIRIHNTGYRYARKLYGKKSMQNNVLHYRTVN